MGCTFDYLNPDDEKKLRDALSSQEVFTLIRGFAGLEANWSDVERYLLKRDSQEIEKSLENLDPQDIPDRLYSMALLCFDHPFPKTKSKMNDGHKLIVEIVGQLYRKAMVEFATLRWDERSQSQFGSFLCYLDSVLPPYAKKTVVGDQPIPASFRDDRIHEPSTTHRRLYEHCQKFIGQLGVPITVENEFDGLARGVFCMDMVLKKGEEVIGFVEVDGDHHYRPRSGLDGEAEKILVRKDLMKENMYAHRYPGVPVKRIPLEGGSFNSFTNSLEEFIVEAHKKTSAVRHSTKKRMKAVDHVEVK